MIIILGVNGQVGQELVVQAGRMGVEFREFSRTQCDIGNETHLKAALAGAKLVINCAGYTAVDKAESEPDVAHQINAVAPGLIARECGCQNAALIHLSTDYVFDGSGTRPWREDDPIAPLNVYGQTKADGEKAVRAVLERNLILRTSWVFGIHGQNFVKTMRRLAKTHPKLSVVCDQHGGPTPAEGIALAILVMADRVLSGEPIAWGTYHLSGQPDTTWFDFACTILEDRPDIELSPIMARDYPASAPRPHNSRMNCSKIKKEFGIERPDWLHGLAQMLSRVKA